MIVLSTARLCAQNAGSSVYGHVYNETTGKNLEGATVTVEGTTISTQTASDGSYTLANVPGGPVTIVVNYPGLDDQSAKIAVKEGGTLEKSFAMNSGIVTLDPFVVSSVFEGNAAAIAKQEKSLTVKNVVATDAWGNVSNGDMGTFLQRLPGVVGEYGGSAVDAILVRGMASNFTTVSMDGTRLAMSNSSSTRSQVVSVLPADAIESVEVIKTPTADMDADSLGGVVNMKSRSGFDRTGRSITLNASANYNETFGKHADPAGGKYVFPRYSIDYSDIFSVFGGKNNLAISFNAAHEMVGQVLASFRIRFANNWDFVPGNTRLQYLEEITNEYFTNERNDWNVRLDYKFNKDSRIYLGYGYNYAFNHLDAVRPDTSVGVSVDAAASSALRTVETSGRYAAQRDIRDTGNTMNRMILGGEHKLPSEMSLDWQVDRSSSGVSQDRISAKPYTNNSYSLIIDRRYDTLFPSVTYTSTYKMSDENFSSVNRMNIDGSENYRNYNYINSGDINLKKEFSGFKIPFNIKTGFRIREEHRDYDKDDFAASSFSGTQSFTKYADTNFTYPYMAGRYDAPTTVDVVSYFRDLGYRYVPGGVDGRAANKYLLVNGSSTTNYLTAANIESNVQNSISADYKTTETIPAYYLQSELTLLPALKMTAGARVEETKTKVVTHFVDKTKTTTEEIYGGWKTLNGKYTKTTPNLQFRYEPMKRLVFRAAFSETIGRPDLGNFTSNMVVDQTNKTINFPNPSIKPQLAKNIDLSAEYYFEPAGFVSVGVFQKKITDFIASQTFNVVGNEFGLDLSQYVGWQGTTSINSGNGTVKGLEVAYGQQFRFLPGPLSGLGFQFNATWMDSEGDYGNTTLKNINPPWKKTLTGFRPRTGNIGLFYLYKAWDFRLMCNYQSDYLTGINTGDFGRATFNGARHQWDLNVRYKLSDRTNLFFDVVNLTTETRSRYFGKVVDERRYYTDIFPRQVNLGVQVRL